MVANGGACEVDEDDDKIVLSFQCGSGGRLIDEGRYDVDGGPYLTLRERSGRTFSRAELPVYCAHCSVNNEIQRVEAGGGADVDRVPADETGRAVRAPRLQGRGAPSPTRPTNGSGCGRLPTLEVRVAALHERLHALGGVGGGLHQLLRVALFLERRCAGSTRSIG